MPTTTKSKSKTERNDTVRTWTYEGYWTAVLGGRTADQVVADYHLIADGLDEWLGYAEHEGALQVDFEDPAAVVEGWAPFHGRALAELRGAVERSEDEVADEPEMEAGAPEYHYSAESSASGAVIEVGDWIVWARPGQVEDWDYGQILDIDAREPGHPWVSIGWSGGVATVIPITMLAACDAFDNERDARETFTAALAAAESPEVEEDEPEVDEVEISDYRVSSDTPNAVDADVVVRFVDGRVVEGEITVLSAEDQSRNAGEWGAWGCPENWASADLVRLGAYVLDQIDASVDGARCDEVVADAAFEPTHVISAWGRDIPVRLVDGLAYERSEWESGTVADWTFDPDNGLLFQGLVVDESSIRRAR